MLMRTGFVCPDDINHVPPPSTKKKACRGLYVAVASSDGFWQRQAQALGWRSYEGGENNVNGGGASGQTSPFAYYSRRMRARVAVRAKLALLRSYLPRRAAVALNPGASPMELAAAEDRLGKEAGDAGAAARLPDELYELLRRCNGQDARDLAAVIADDARLLAADELWVTEERDVPPVRLAPELRCGGNDAPSSSSAALAATVDEGRLSGGWERRPFASVAEAETTARGLPDDGHNSTVRLIIFAANSGRSRLFGVAIDGGQVYVCRGTYTTARIADSIVGFLQRLLR